jgi:hypothetical protein
MTQQPLPPTIPWLVAALRPHLLVGLLAMAPLAGAQAAVPGAPVVRIATPAEQVVMDGATAEIPAEAEEVGVEVAAAGVGSFVLELDGAIVATIDAPSATAVDVPVSAGGDAEEFLEPSRADPVRWPSGFTYVSSSDLEFGHDPSHGDQVVAVRFVDLGIPAGARILWAEIVFTADGRSDGELRLVVWGERAADGAPFVEDPAREPSGGLSSRPRTAATALWALDEPWRPRERYATPDLAAIVQEVVDLDGWHDRAALVLLFEAEEPGTTFRRAVSVSASADDDTTVARLHVDYLWPAEAALPVGATLAVPPGRHELRVRAFAGTAGRGDTVGTTQVTLERPAIEAEPEPVAEPIAEPEPEAEPVEEPAPDAEPETVEEPAPEAEPETPKPDAEPVEEPAPDAEPETEPEPVEEPAPDAEPAPEPAPVEEPAPDAEPETETEPLEEPAPDAEPETETEPLEEPAPDAEPVQEPAPTAEPESDPEPLEEPAPDAEPAPLEEPASDAEPETEPEPLEEPAPDAEPETEPVQEPAPAAEPESDPEPLEEPAPDAEPEPEPVEEPAPDAEPETEPVPSAPTPTTPPAPATPSTVARSSTATRIDMIHVRAIRTVIVVGDAELTAYDDATSSITLTWRRPRSTPLLARIHAGTCADPGDVLLQLLPLGTTDAESVTRLPLSGSSLRLGGFVLLVEEAGGEPVGCADLRR